MTISISDYYPSSSPEAKAWAHVERYTHTHLVTVNDLAYAARYDALRTYISGDGVYIPPRNVRELKELLDRHALSYLYTHNSYLRPSPQGSAFSDMKNSAISGLRDLVRIHSDVLLRLYENEADWDGHPSPPGGRGRRSLEKEFA